MKRLTFISILLIASTQVAVSQVLPPQDKSGEVELIKSESRRYSYLMTADRISSPGDNIDVKYYKLDLTITTNPNYLRGNVTIEAASVVSNLSIVKLDLADSMVVDSVKMQNKLLTFARGPNTVDITLDQSYGMGEMIELRVFYRGLPVSTGFGSFAFSSQAGKPWVWTLSEPYGAKGWWPCKDHPADKADSLDVWVTCDSTLKVGSNGKLVSVVSNGDGTKTFRWSTKYPIATYLVSLAITNYAEFSNWFRYSPSDSMQVLNYVLPSNVDSARANLPKAVDMLGIYSNLFGLYPFINEKYGHAQFGWSGGMEHQTMTSLGGFGENLVAHELAHSWFGDMITCATWPNIWLNEGFATYCVALYREAKYGATEYWKYVNGQMSTAMTANGAVYVLDSSSVGTLFNGARVYSKGATVLHMLRHVLGDSTFFRAMKSYATDSRFMYKTATTQDFQEVCEKVSGLQLRYFFQQWVYGQGYPQYSYSWSARPAASGYDVTISVAQTTGATNPAFFTMPVDFKLSALGWDTTVVLINNSKNQQFMINVSHNPSSVRLDPDNWILRSTTLVPTLLGSAGENPAEYALEQNYPNPFNSETTIRFALPRNENVTLKVYNTLGQVVATLENGQLSPGIYKVAWNAGNLPSGVYFYRLRAGQFVSTKRLVIIR